MERRNLEVEQGLKEEETMTMLFGKGIECFAKDEFEGSKEENQIFMEILYQTWMDDDVNNKAVSSEPMNLQPNGNSSTKTCGNLNCGSSGLTSLSSMKYSPLAKMNAKEGNGSGYSTESPPSLAALDACNVTVNRPKLLCDSSGGHRRVPIRIVETFGHGVLSSYHLTTLGSLSIGSADVNDTIASKSKSRSKQKGDGSALMEAKFDATPDSDKSHAYRRLVSSTPVGLQEIRKALVNRRAEEFEILDPNFVGVSRKSEFLKDLPKCLRVHAVRLLTDIGWKPEIRKRRVTNQCDYYYKSPDGRYFSSLVKAWVSCGERLYADSLNSEVDEHGRQWFDIDGFWDDLADTLVYIEKEIQREKKALSHLLQWQLLDPFMAVVCIDRKVGFLREGGLLKAVNSTTYVLKADKNINLEMKGADGVKRHAAESNSCLINSSRRSLLPVFMSDGRSGVNENSCSQELSALRDSSDMKNKRKFGRMGRRACSGAHTHSRSLKSLARRIGKGLSDPRDLKGTKCKALATYPKIKNQASNSSTSTQKSSNSYFVVGGPANESHEIAAPLLEKSQTNDNVSSKAAYSNMLADCGIQESGVSSSPKREFLVRNEPCKEMKNDYHAENVLSQRKDAQCNARKLAHEITINVPIKAVDHLEILESSSTRGGSVKEFPCSEECYKVEGNFVSKVEADNANTEAREEELNEVAQQIPRTSGDACNLFMMDQTSVYPMPKEQVLYLYPQHRTLCFSVDESFGQRFPGCVSNTGSSGGVHMLQEVQPSVYHASLGNGVLVFGLNSNLADNTNFPFPQVELNLIPQEDPSLVGNVLAQSSLKKSKDRRQKVDGVLGPSRSGRKRGSVANSDSNSIRKTRKRPAKVRREGMPECLDQTDCLEKESDKASGVVIQHASAVLSFNPIEKARKGPEKLETKAVKRGRKRKKVTVPLSLEDESAKTGCDVASEGSKPCASLRLSPDKSLFKSENVVNRYSDCRESVVAFGEAENPFKPHYENNYDEAMVLANNKFPDLNMENGQKKQPRSCIDDDTLIVTTITNNEDCSSKDSYSASEARGSRKKAFRKRKKRNVNCTLTLQASECGGEDFTSGRRPFLHPRTVLSWLIKMGVISLYDTVQYRDSKSNAVVKEGRVVRKGIRCKCCKKILCVSEFKFHAGSKVLGPSYNLFLKSGETYTLCQLEAWSAEYKMRKGLMPVMDSEEVNENDDACALCGDGGELVCCDNCPSAYHRACLAQQDLPEGSWYCPCCICNICGDVITVTETSSSSVALTCLQCDNRYHETCTEGNISSCNRKLGSDSWFCGGKCQEIYVGLRSHVGEMNYIEDGYYWSILRCNHKDQKFHSAQKIALMAECHTKLAIALSIMEECFVPMVDPITGIHMIPHVLYNWGSKFARLNYEGFYTIILEKGDEVISVACIRVHGVTMAEMPLIATCTERRRQGMCRRLMGAIEEMLKSLKVEMLVLSAIPDLLDTWITGFGFQPMEDHEKKRISNISLMSFPGAVLLKKNLYEENDSYLSSTNDQFQNLRLGESTFVNIEGSSVENAGKEQVDGQQNSLPIPSCQSLFSAIRNKDDGGFSNLELSNILLGTLNSRETSEVFSKYQELVVQKSAERSSNTTNSQDAHIDTMNDASDVVRKEQAICGLEVDEVEHKREFEASEETRGNRADAVRKDWPLLSTGAQVSHTGMMSLLHRIISKDVPSVSEDLQSLNRSVCLTGEHHEHPTNTILERG